MFVVNLRSSRLRRAVRAAGGAALVLLVMSGCTQPPTRERTTDAALFEITGDRTARLTLRANRPTFLSDEPVPRRGRRSDTTITAASSSTQPLTSAELVAGLKASLQASEHPRTGLTQPRTTVTALADMLAANVKVTRVRARPDLVVADLRFPRLAPDVRFKPAAVVRTLQRGGMSGGTIWVGVCTASSRGEWVSSTDTFDQRRGCAGWVPTANATSVGVLHHRSGIAAETWWIVLLAVLTVLLLACCVVRAVVRPFARIRKLWLGSLTIFLVTFGVTAGLMRTVVVTNDVHDIFGATVESSTHDLAVTAASYSAVLSILAFATTIWAFGQPEEAGRPASRSLRWPAKPGQLRRKPPSELMT